MAPEQEFKVFFLCLGLGLGLGLGVKWRSSLFFDLWHIDLVSKKQSIVDQVLLLTFIYTTIAVRSFENWL